MRILVTGVCGQLGHDVMDELAARGIMGMGTDVLPTGKYEEKLEALKEDKYRDPYLPLDITDEEAVEKFIGKFVPDRVIHCAAWTQVDAAEDEENREKVYAVNVKGTENLAKACAEYDIPMTYISTDYVFDGKGEEPRKPDCTDYAPQNWYGKTKLLGEKTVADNLDDFYIVRIAWVFGKNGNNFIRTMLRLAENHDTLRVVNDQIGTPTYTYDLARLLVDMNLTDKYGYYHVTNEGGYISWYDFACEIFKEAAELKVPALSGSGAAVDYAGVKVIPVTTEEYGLSKAVRPYNSRLDKSRLEEEGFKPLPDWKDALHRYLKELQ